MATQAMKRYTARGVVLGTLKYGDRGVVVHMLTSSHGRQSYMVQGVGSRRAGQKMALFQPMFALEFEGLESSKMQMHRFGAVQSGGLTLFLCCCQIFAYNNPAVPRNSGIVATLD